MPRTEHDCFYGGYELAATTLPPVSARQRSWYQKDVTRVRLHKLFARVSVVHSASRHDITLHVTGRNNTLRCFQASVAARTHTLTLTCAPPFDGSNPQVVMPCNCLEMMLLVPSSTVLIVEDVIGSIGVAPGLEAIEFARSDLSHRLHFYTSRAKLVTGIFGGKGLVTIDQVDDPSSNLEVAGPGIVQLGMQSAVGR